MKSWRNFSTALAAAVTVSGVFSLSYANSTNLKAQHSMTSALASTTESGASLAISKTNGGETARYRGDGGAVFGYVFNDRDGDGERGIRERGLNRVLVYLDKNDNGTRDEDELSTRTKRNGFYAFTGLPAGDYVVRQEVKFGWRNTSGGMGEDVTPRVLDTSNAPANDGVLVPQIIGGDEVDIDDYPFMAALMFEFIDDEFPEFSGVFQFCGGVLISDRFVATAAHCLEGSTEDDIASFKILLGSNDVGVELGDTRLLDVVSISRHPMYTECDPNGPFDQICSVIAGFDVAVMELAEAIDLKASGLQSISMLGRSNSSLADTDVLATSVGWGFSDRNSLLLQDVHLPVIDSAQCETLYTGLFGAINFDTQICAGAPEGGISSCFGDSGGPLLVRNFKSERWRVAGFTSYGTSECGAAGFPGVYARASELSSWIKSQAREPSRVYRLTVSEGEASKAVFGNMSTRFERRLPIDPRWQLVNVGYSGDIEQGYSADYRIIDEAKAPRVFNCASDLDGSGPLEMQFFECRAGAEQYRFPFDGNQIVSGIFGAQFTAEGAGADYVRTVGPRVLGQPEQSTVSGELTSDDALDPDYLQSTDPDFPPMSYYIDYYDLSDFVDENLRAIYIQTDGFEPLVSLYDRDTRETNGEPFASSLDGFGASSPDDLTRGEYLFNYQEINSLFGFERISVDTRLLLGVSSWEELTTGSYTVTIVNGGGIDATTITLPQGDELRLRSVERNAYIKEQDRRQRQPVLYGLQQLKQRLTQ